MGVTVNVTGVQKLIADLQAISVEGERMANAVVGVIADKITAAQKISAPADLGTIRNNLGNIQLAPALREIFSNAPESPYQEFGTGPQVNIPAEWSEAAAEFQGTGGGSWADFILALTDWVKRHGLTGVYSVKTQRRNNRLSNTDADQQAAWAIARSILKRGLAPQPFFYYNVEDGFAQLDPMLEKAYDELMNKSI